MEFKQTDADTRIIRYLQKNLSEEEKIQFYHWVESDPANKKRYFDTKALYDNWVQARNPISVDDSWERLLGKRMASKQTTGKRSRPLWLKVASYAAVSLVAVALTALWFMEQPAPASMAAQYVGGNGIEADIVILPDGTEISLGTKSTFWYETDYGKTQRIVHLRGEAYFNVAKEKDKPFIVKVDGQQIEALGTKFNVMAYPADTVTVTTLLEGSVRLSMEQGGQISILKPNQQHIYNKNKQRVLVKDVDAAQYTAWTTGYYYFPEQTMESMLGRLANLYGVTFDVQTASLNQRKFTGTLYRGQRIEDIMEIISLSIPIRYKVNDHHITIIKK
ncbi:FecR family protein [Macellibacteroides fermentans]|uniref:FecR family protein n=1 Tax=Parabacteroides chartae TaxID=1037355 RepID=A0A1T5AN15_9BACT|nr:FecR family protein [Parabacteroides chartae]SKB36197.1 FecR family protein [Parabacteroides chartae]